METTTSKIDFTKLSSAQLKALAQEREAQELEERKRARQAYEEQEVRLAEHIFSGAKDLEKTMCTVKQDWNAKLIDFSKFLRNYSHREGDWKGNLTVLTADKLGKVEYNLAELGDYDARANEGSALIIDFIESEVKEPSTIKILKGLLEPKKGKFDRENILKLLKLEDDFSDERWRKGLQLIKEAYRPKGTKAYIRVFKRSDLEAAWEPVVLNFAAIS